MADEQNGTNSKRALAAITKDTLLPLGLVIGLVAGGIWIGQKVERFAQVEVDVKKLDSRVWLVEDAQATWRREIETAIGQRLSDPKPKGARRDDESTQVQDHQVRTASSSDGEDGSRPGGGVGGPLDGRGGGRADLGAGDGGREDRGRDPGSADRLSSDALAALSGAPMIRPGW